MRRGVDVGLGQVPVSPARAEARVTLHGGDERKAETKAGGGQQQTPSAEKSMWVWVT